MVLYWDTSAILSTLVEDEHSFIAKKIEKKRGYHFASSLCFAEMHAVLKRMEHEGVLTEILYKSAIESFENGPIRKMNILPEWKIIQDLSVRYILKGADLWHLASVKTIQLELTEIKMFSFDSKLITASKKEKIAFGAGTSHTS